MSPQLPSGAYVCENATLAGTRFHKVNLSQSVFANVNLRDTRFDDVALTRASIRNACLGDVSIADANYTGMTIEGILVTELLRVYREHAAPGPDPALP